MSKIKKVIDLLKMAGIDYSKIAGKVDPNVTKLVTKTQETARKPKLIDALNKKKATYQQALDIFENDAKYISQMNEMELVNFANNLDDYFKVGGEVKYRPSNVVTPEGTPVVGKKLETLAERKGAKGKTEATSLRGAMEGLMTLVDEIKGISPKMRNQMDRDELVEFIRKMRGRDFTNQEIKLVREYMDEWGIGLAKEKAAPAMAHAKKLGAKDKEEFKFIEEYLDDIQTTSPKDFREMYGNVKNINMKLSEIFDAKLEKHFKKKYKWDDTKRDGGLDDATFEKYEDELYDAQKEFGDFHRVYDTDVEPGMFGVRKSTSWAKNPKEYLDEASEQLKSITGEGLNTNFWKNYTEEVLGKYPKPEKFQYGGLAGMLGEPTYQDDNHRMPYNKGGSISDVLPPDFDELDPEEMIHIIKLLQTGEIPQYASGGRVPFKLGGKGKVLEGLAKLFDEFFPGTTKIGQTSKPMAEKTQLRKAIADFQERENVIIDGKKYKRSDKDRPPTEEELEDDYAELWDDENSPLDFGSTVRELDAALVDRAEEYKYMYQQYKMGKLDPEAGSVSRARLNLLRKRAEEAENTKDFRLFGEDEADELDYLEDHFAQVDKEESFQFAERARKAKEKAADKQSPWYTDPKTLTPEEELRREFPGISDDLIKNILADDNPQRIAEVKATLKEALKMQEKGMSTEEIINIFKKKPTKHASGGLAGMLGE